MHHAVEVILASQSPRRRELLSLVGITHAVRPADIDESVLPGEFPVPHTERLARAKAHRLAEAHPLAVVIAADTIVVLDGDILGKPRDAVEARAMLVRLSGRTHTVFTAIAVALGARPELQHRCTELQLMLPLVMWDQERAVADVGTLPTLFVGSKALSGDLSASRVRREIDAALEAIKRAAVEMQK